jgi:hypothetical protein
MSTRVRIARLLGLAQNTSRRPCRDNLAAFAGRTRQLGLELLEDRLSPATLTVNSTADTATPSDPYLSLREAVALVNSPTLPGGLSTQIQGQINGTLHASGADQIVFDPTQVSTPITLTQGQLELSLPGTTAAVTIDGGGGVTVDGNNACRVLKVDSGVQATLNRLTITHGQADYGGGIDTNGTVTLNDSTIDGCIGAHTGGISNDGGAMTINRCTISGNTGHDISGGIWNGGLMTVSNSTLAYNSAPSADSRARGGGIINGFRATLTISNSTLTGNRAGSPIFPVGGGGIYNMGLAVVNNSTLSSNFADTGGGIFNDGTLSLQSTIVAGNFAGSGGPDVAGTVVPSSGYNLIGDGNGLGGILNRVHHNQIGTDFLPLDPLLAPLDYYGGPTPTFALVLGSPALGTGDPAATAATDERGQPRAVNGQVDVGAFQSQASPFVVTTVQDPGRLSGLLSLREAVTLANALPYSHTITFDPALGSGTISLTGSPLELVNVSGVEALDGGSRFTLDGGNRIRLLQVDPGTQAVLINLRLGDGSSNVGGAVLNFGTLTVGNSTLFANTAIQGGAIYNVGTLTVFGCTLMFNQAQQGGGIYDAGLLTAFNSTFVRNVGDAGGAILVNSSVSAVLTSLSISQNFSNTGAGLDVVNGSVLLRNCIVCGNSTGGTDLAGTVSASSSYNLIGSGGGGLSNGVNHNLVGVADPGLTTPDFSSAQTPVFGFTASSPALGAGDPLLLREPLLSLDQHGNVRASPVNIGAL